MPSGSPRTPTTARVTRVAVTTSLNTVTDAAVTIATGEHSYGDRRRVRPTSGFRAAYGGGFAEDARFRPRLRPCTRHASVPVHTIARFDSRRVGDGSPPDGNAFEEGSPLSKITTLRPRTTARPAPSESDSGTDSR